MNFSKAYEFLANRIPVSQIPITWDSMGYTSESFNLRVSSPDFTQWEDAETTEEEAGIIARLLQPVPGNSLLDIACGYGRHDLLLAGKYGLKVTGTDISPGQITAARRLAGEQGLKINYEVSHARDLSPGSYFDLVMVADNSFSLFSPEDAAVVLDNIYKALKSSGCLFLDLDNKPYNCRYGITDTNWSTFPGGLILQEVYFHENISVEVCRDITFRTTTEDAEEFITFKRIYSIDEIGKLLEQCSFKMKRIYGDWDVSPLAEDSPKMILVAEKV